MPGTSIVTRGNYAFGAAARSIGGGGGNGGGGFGLFYSGGSGGSTGGAGGQATVNNNATIETFGEGAYGILAQSIGGGGGDGGSSGGLVAIGGKGSGGGEGGTASVTNGGSVTTHGLFANAILAQSIGGGGGNGGSSGGLVALGGNGAGTTTGGSVTVTNSGTLKAYASFANGILAQSIGGGGGNGGSSAGLFSFGGDGGLGADAGSVTVFSGGNIETGINGGSVNANGIMAQSVGGGGGNGGNSIAFSPLVAVAVGGSGNMGGNGSNVRVLRDNPNGLLATQYDITTHGYASNAIMAQSIGGGGGNGGYAVSASVGNVASFSVGVGGNGAGGGSAGSVRVETLGTLNTEADSSAAILANRLAVAAATAALRFRELRVPGYPAHSRSAVRQERVARLRPSPSTIEAPFTPRATVRAASSRNPLAAAVATAAMASRQASAWAR